MSSDFWKDKWLKDRYNRTADKERGWEEAAKKRREEAEAARKSPPEAPPNAK